MEAFQDRLARLTELTADELSALEQEMVAAFDAADAAGDVETMQALADSLDEVRAAMANAAPTGEAPAEEAVAASADAPAETTDETTTDEQEATVDETPDTPEETEAVEAEATEEATEVPTEAAETEAVQAEADLETDAAAEVPAEDTNIDITAEADAEALAELEEIVADEVTSEDVPAENQPELVTASAPYVITAGGDIPGFTAGQTLADMDEAIEALTARANTLLRATGEVRSVVASLQREFDEDKTLRKSDPYGNSEKIRQIVKAGREGGVEALTAAGWCAPKTPIYDHVNGMAIGVTDTPVLDSLPTVGVDRGGIVWTPPMSIAQIPTAQFGSWVVQRDANGNVEFGTFVPGTSGTVPAAGTAQVDKPCIDIPCPPEEEAELGAIPLCLCTDVLMSRANPEFIRHFTDLVLVAQARFKEQWALAHMYAASRSVGTPGNKADGTLGVLDVPLGVARDILLVWRATASNFRWVNRLSPTQTLRVYAPSWLRDAMVSDLTVQMPGDDTLSLSYAQIEADIADINLDVVWYIDDMPGGTGISNPGDFDFDSMLGYAQQALWMMTVPGAVVHLDGGSLDLGVQRTKEDIQKNRFCEFAETFEGLAYMGPKTNGWLIAGTTPIEIRGGFAPAVAAVPAGGILAEA